MMNQFSETRSRGGFSKEFKSMSLDERTEDYVCRESKSSNFMDFDFDDENECMLLCGDGGSAEDKEFDYLVSLFEEVLISPEFTKLQNSFCSRHCQIFQENDENKLEYTTIFDQYTESIEGFLENQVRKVVPDFQIDRFASLCSKRQNEMTGDVFDTLLSCGDFEEFKFIMLSYKAAANGQTFGMSMTIN